MSYTSFADLADTIRKNLWKVPDDIDLIVGVPRSGLMAALMLGEYLHKPVMDLPSFLAGWRPASGGRSKHMRSSESGRVLILDDTVFSGGSMSRVMEQVEASDIQRVVIYGCIYAEGKDAKEKVDVFFEDNYNPNEEIWHLYEWNILHHGIKLSKRCMFDLDGVLCKEPPDERDEQQYVNYIANARPMILPTTKIGCICTYRLDKYRALTEEWLRKNGVEYERLIMFKAEDYETRKLIASPAKYKAIEYRFATWATLFIESDPKQAEEIHRLTGKQVFCYENGKMYGKGN